LVGRIGDAAGFYIGDEATIVAETSGRLQLAYNDCFFPDNRGRFQVTLSVSRPDLDASTIEWANQKWFVRSTDIPEGPGPNLYARENVWVDTAGKLHLRIVKRKGKWTCAEIFSAERFGFGEYRFTVETELTAIDRAAVLGMFVYDGLNCRQMYSEIDIEVACWKGVEEHNLHHTVQPGWLDLHECDPDAAPVEYPERRKRWLLFGSNTEHVFRWTPDEVYFESINTERGFGLPWRFPTSPVRRRGRCQDCTMSEEVLVPSPGPDTRVRINFWLQKKQQLQDGTEEEVVLTAFEFL
jgi:hypothetical protein